MADDDFAGCPARDHPARRVALCAFHAQLSRRRRSARRAWAGCLLRNGATVDLEVRAIVRSRTAPSTPSANVAMASRRDGRSDCGPSVLAVAPVDDEGEVLDLLVRRPCDKPAAVKLMRKLLKKRGVAPDVLVTDKLRSYGAATTRSASWFATSGVCARTMGPRMRINRRPASPHIPPHASRPTRRSAPDVASRHRGLEVQRGFQTPAAPTQVGVTAPRRELGCEQRAAAYADYVVFLNRFRRP